MNAALLQNTCNIEKQYEGDFLCEIGSVMLKIAASRHSLSMVLSLILQEEI
jgi:hypothetical protein